MGMINLLVEKRKLTRLDAYGLTSIAGGLPARRNLGGREERTLPDAEESVAGPEVNFPHHAERAAVRQPFLIFGTGLLSYVDVSRCPR